MAHVPRCNHGGVGFGDYCLEDPGRRTETAERAGEIIAASTRYRISPNRQACISGTGRSFEASTAGQPEYHLSAVYPSGSSKRGAISGSGDLLSRGVQSRLSG